MLRAVSIARVEIDLHAHAITHCCTGCLSNLTVKIQIEASVAHGHHVDSPRIVGFAIDAHEDRERLAPARLDGICTGTTDEDERVDISNLDDRGEACRHGNCPPTLTMLPHPQKKRRGP